MWSGKRTTDMRDNHVEQSGYSSVAQEIPPFTIEDNYEETRQNKMHAFLACLIPNFVTDQIIVDCVRIAKSKELRASLGMSNLANKVILPHIVNDKRY